LKLESLIVGGNASREIQDLIEIRVLRVDRKKLVLQQSPAGCRYVGDGERLRLTKRLLKSDIPL
jgi:hypothetical protein